MFTKQGEGAFHNEDGGILRYLGQIYHSEPGKPRKLNQNSIQITWCTGRLGLYALSICKSVFTL